MSRMFTGRAGYNVKGQIDLFEYYLYSIERCAKKKDPFKE